ncbi:hypothetical protein ACFLQY_04465 [Verrucomicrobiota bacterium]
MNEIGAEIRRYMTGFPAMAERAGLVSVLSLLIRRHNRIAFLALFFLMVIAVVVSLGLVIIHNEKAEAIAAREKAESNFQLYREQQEESIKLGADLSKLSSFALRTRDYSRAREKIRVFEVAIKKSMDPAEKKDLLSQKATMHFVLEQFYKAYCCFEEARPTLPNDQDTWKLSQKYAEIKPDDKEVLTIRQLIELVKEAKLAIK